MKLLIFSFLISPIALATANGNISVYKYDNSKQCEWSSGVPLKTMQKELKGIKVFKAVQQSDGKMYASVCGGPTGMINVYEIAEKDLNKAEKLGFKRLSTH